MWGCGGHVYLLVSTLKGSAYMGQKLTPIECMPFISLQNSVERSLYKGFYAAILSITSQKGLPRSVLYISQNQQIVPAEVRQNPV